MPDDKTSDELGDELEKRIKEHRERERQRKLDPDEPLRRTGSYRDDDGVLHIVQNEPLDLDWGDLPESFDRETVERLRMRDIDKLRDPKSPLTDLQRTSFDEAYAAVTAPLSAKVFKNTNFSLVSDELRKALDQIAKSAVPKVDVNLVLPNISKTLENAVKDLRIDNDGWLRLGDSMVEGIEPLVTDQFQGAWEHLDESDRKGVLVDVDQLLESMGPQSDETLSQVMQAMAGLASGFEQQNQLLEQLVSINRSQEELIQQSADRTESEKLFGLMISFVFVTTLVSGLIDNAHERVLCVLALGLLATIVLYWAAKFLRWGLRRRT